MRRVNGGVWLVLIFLLSQAVRDVYLAGTFQTYSLAQVLAPLFLATTVIFAVRALAAGTGQFALLRANAREIVAVNLATACAWLSYFVALKWLEPALVNAFHEGVIPLAVVASILLAGGRRPQGWTALATYLAMLGVLVYLAVVILHGKSGLTSAPLESWLGVLLALASGVFITWGILSSKQLNRRGMTPDTVMALRFVVVTLVAAALVLGNRAALAPWSELAPILGLSFFLVVAPLYLFQKAIDLAPPVTVGVVTSLGPILIFAVQAVEGRIGVSIWSLAGVVTYSALAILANVQQGWSAQD